MYEEDYGGSQQLYYFKDYAQTVQTRLEPELDPSLLATLHETPSQFPGRVQHMNSALHEPLGLDRLPNIRGGGNSRDRQWTATFGSGNQWSPACPPVESAEVHWGAIVPVAPDRSPVELAGVQSMQTQ
ncbi:hypothetical protein B0H17DRAFT_1127149 [Mycena rosella]|uniref:Uncharacterized protein n=1 Tax=Mycena rosella TaxID=1033263 RepID=A0AAD7DZP7_MYCRO|nr:hypothetical protein B0H17DRAFT_1127149 [Mycena rosella]